MTNEIIIALLGANLSILITFGTWLIRRVLAHETQFARLSVLLTGFNGDNGMVTDVRQLKQQIKELREKHL